MPKTGKILLISAVVALSAFCLLYFFLLKTRQWSGRQAYNQCNIEERPLRVNGNSLDGLVKDGTEMKALMGFYACNDVRRGDLALYRYAGDKNPLIKIVKGLPGDKFRLEKSPAGCWRIMINEKVLENSAGQPYCFNENGHKILSLYERDYGGAIPPRAYLILGNNSSGSLDSGRFGLADKTDLLGKVVAD